MPEQELFLRRQNGRWDIRIPVNHVCAVHEESEIMPSALHRCLEDGGPKLSLILTLMEKNEDCWTEATSRNGKTDLTC